MWPWKGSRNWSGMGRAPRVSGSSGLGAGAGGPGSGSFGVSGCSICSILVDSFTEKRHCRRAPASAVGGTVNDYLVSVLLGIIEGLTEFLPVSSTAHLRLAEALFKLPLDEPYWKMYTIVVQLGAVLCLPIYFRARIAAFLAKRDGPWTSHPLTLVMVAFVVTAIPAFLMSKIIGKHLESLTLMGSALLIGGIVMWVVDAWKAPWEKLAPGAPGSSIRTWSMETMTLRQAIIVGACQVLSALFP